MDRMLKRTLMIALAALLLLTAACGAENDLPVLIRPGMKFHCTECGAELEI